jgi:hypothetical protein
VGHIGKVTSIFPWDEVVHISNIEFTGTGESGYVEFYTAYYADELEIFTAPDKPLKNAIKKTLDNLE